MSIARRDRLLRTEIAVLHALSKLRVLSPIMMRSPTWRPRHENSNHRDHPAEPALYHRRQHRRRGVGRQGLAHGRCAAGQSHDRRGSHRLGRSLRLQRDPSHQGGHREHAGADVRRTRSALRSRASRSSCSRSCTSSVAAVRSLTACRESISRSGTSPERQPGKPVHQLLGGCRAPTACRATPA